MNKEQVLGIIRHVLTALGVVLVYKGITDEGTVLTVIGAVVSATSGIWSLFNNTEAQTIQRANKMKLKSKL